MQNLGPFFLCLSKVGDVCMVIFVDTRPLPSYLVGKNSFFDNIPMQVLAASFDVDEQTLSSIWEGRRHDEAIFPPPVA